MEQLDPSGSGRAVSQCVQEHSRKNVDFVRCTSYGLISATVLYGYTIQVLYIDEVLSGRTYVRCRRTWWEWAQLVASWLFAISPSQILPLAVWRVLQFAASWFRGKLYVYLVKRWRCAMFLYTANLNPNPRTFGGQCQLSSKTFNIFSKQK